MGNILSLVLLVSTLIGLFGAGCSSMQTKTDEQGNVENIRLLPIDIDGSVREETQGQSFAMAKSEDIRDDESFRQIERALVLAGFVKETAGKSKLQVKVEFKLDKPILGSSVFGMLTPFKHTVILKAYKGAEIAWQTMVTGPSEFEDRRATLPVILGAGVKYYGKDTKGETRVDFSESDVNVKVIRAVK